jgi:hypothetical protein
MIELVETLTPKAKKEHLCIWCGETIDAKEKYTRQNFKMDGDFQSNAYHNECFDALLRSDLYDEEFYPHEQLRGLSLEEQEEKQYESEDTK